MKIAFPSPCSPASFVIVLALFSGATAQAADATWNSAADAAWATNANPPWSTGLSPGAVGTTTNTDIATFGSVVLTANQIVTVDAGRNIGGITFDGANTSGFGYTLATGPLVLSSGGVIQTNGAGGNNISTISAPLTLEGEAAFTATSTNNNRRLNIAGTVTGSATTGNTSTLTLNGTIAGNLAANGASVNAVGGTISNGANGGTLAVSKSDAGSWKIEGNNTYTGGTTINAGTLIATSVNSLGAAGAAVNLAGGTLSLRVNVANDSALGNFSYNKAITVIGNSTIDVQRLGQGGQKNIQNSGALNVVGAQTVTITNAYGYSLQQLGATTVNANTTFQNNMNSFQGGGSVAVNPNGFTLSTLSVADTAATGTTANVTFGVVATGTNNNGNNTGNTIVSGAISNNATDATKALAITKTGAGILTLAGANTYTGGTTITAGTLNVTNTTGSGVGTGAVTIGTLGTLGGTGTVGANITSAGIIAPGVTGIGTLTALNSLTLDTGASFKFDLSLVGNTSDLLALTGDFTKGSGSSFNFDFGNIGAAYQTYTLLTFGSLSGFTPGDVSNFTFSNFAPGGSFSLTNNSLTFSTVPEPQQYTLLIAGLLFAMIVLRRRRAVQEV